MNSAYGLHGNGTEISLRPDKPSTALLCFGPLRNHDQICVQTDRLAHESSRNIVFGFRSNREFPEQLSSYESQEIWSYYKALRKTSVRVCSQPRHRPGGIAKGYGQDGRSSNLTRNNTFLYFTEFRPILGPTHNGM